MAATEEFIPAHCTHLALVGPDGLFLGVQELIPNLDVGRLLRRRLAAVGQSGHASDPMCALMPKCRLLAFFVDDISGSAGRGLFVRGGRGSDNRRARHGPGSQYEPLIRKITINRLAGSVR